MVQQKLQIKAKSFGIIEAIISSSILIVILSAATFLMFNSRKSVELSTARFQAEQIANDIFQRLSTDKATGLVSFVDTSSDEDFPVECYDISQISNSECKIGTTFKGKIPFSSVSEGGYGNLLTESLLSIPKARMASNFVDGYFKMDIKIDHGLSACKAIGTLNIPEEKCVMMKIKIKWNEKGKDRFFANTQYFTDWEN